MKIIKKILYFSFAMFFSMNASAESLPLHNFVSSYFSFWNTLLKNITSLSYKESTGVTIPVPNTPYALTLDWGFVEAGNSEYDLSQPLPPIKIAITTHDKQTPLFETRDASLSQLLKAATEDNIPDIIQTTFFKAVTTNKQLSPEYLFMIKMAFLSLDRTQDFATETFKLLRRLHKVENTWLLNSTHKLSKILPYDITKFITQNGMQHVLTTIDAICLEVMNTGQTKNLYQTQTVQSYAFTNKQTASNFHSLISQELSEEERSDIATSFFDSQKIIIPFDDFRSICSSNSDNTSFDFASHVTVNATEMTVNTQIPQELKDALQARNSGCVLVEDKTQTVFWVAYACDELTPHNALLLGIKTILDADKEYSKIQRVYFAAHPDQARLLREESQQYAERMKYLQAFFKTTDGVQALARLDANIHALEQKSSIPVVMPQAHTAQIAQITTTQITTIYSLKKQLEETQLKIEALAHCAPTDTIKQQRELLEKQTEQLREKIVAAQSNTTLDNNPAAENNNDNSAELIALIKDLQEQGTPIPANIASLLKQQEMQTGPEQTEVNVEQKLELRASVAAAYLEEVEKAKTTLREKQATTFDDIQAKRFDLIDKPRFNAYIAQLEYKAKAIQDQNKKIKELQALKLLSQKQGIQLSTQERMNGYFLKAEVGNIIKAKQHQSFVGTLLHAENNTVGLLKRILTQPENKGIATRLAASLQLIISKTPLLKKNTRSLGLSIDLWMPLLAPLYHYAMDEK